MTNVYSLAVRDNHSDLKATSRLSCRFRSFGHKKAIIPSDAKALESATHLRPTSLFILDLQLPHGALQHPLKDLVAQSQALRQTLL